MVPDTSENANPLPAGPPTGDSASPPGVETAGSPFSRLIRIIERAWPADEWQNHNLLVAVSGGPDSTALLIALDAIHRRVPGTSRLGVVHVNHRLRPENDQHAKFVESLARSLELPYLVQSLPDTPASPVTGTPSEDVLRAARYDCLKTAAKRFGARHVVTAHHQDDQIETLLFRILRGTGLAGLRGIPPFRVDGDVTFVRPLLHADRALIRAALEERHQPYQTDSTNAQSVATRNFLRNELLPLIETRFPAPGASLLRLQQQASLVQDWIAQQAPEPETCYHRRGDHGWVLDRDVVRDQHPMIVHHVLTRLWHSAGWPSQAMSQLVWQRIIQAIQAPGPTPAMTLPGAIRMECSSRQCVFKKTNPGEC